MATRWRAGLGRRLSSIASLGTVPHRPTFTTSLFAALLAVGVVLGFVAVRTTDHSSHAALPPSTTAPRPLHVTTTSPPATTTPTAPTAPTATPPATAAATALGPCRRADLQVTVAVSGSGGATAVTTVLTDVVACSWQPVTVSGDPCPDTIAVEDSTGSQVWPAPGQAEQCSTPGGRVLGPGQVETLAATWADQVLSGSGTTAAPPGPYTAVGTWSWATDGGRPDQASASQSFTLS